MLKANDKKYNKQIKLIAKGKQWKMLQNCIFFYLNPKKFICECNMSKVHFGTSFKLANLKLCTMYDV